jgi:hypothetical protein
MRTRGIDGLCFSCYQPPPLRCVRCGRVRYLLGSPDWQTHPGQLVGEIPATCATCGEEQRAKAEAAYWRDVRALERRKERGFGPAPDGVDVFAGFREGE